MTTIIGLPEETIAHICSSFNAKSDDIKSLSNLSKCCWTLRRIAEDSLYHVIEACVETPTQYRVPRLIRTLLARPTLAAKIKKLVIGTNALIDEQDESGEWDELPLAYHYIPSVFGGDLLVAACIDKIIESKLYGPGRAFWILGLTRRNVTAFIGFLLTLLPNLNDLGLDITQKDTVWGGASHVLERLFMSGVFRSTIDPTSMKPWVDFSKVKRLFTNGLNLEILALDFPNLQELELDLIEGGQNHAYGTVAYTCNILRTSTIIPPYPQLRIVRLHTDWEDLETHLEAPRCTAALLEVVRCTNLVAVEFRLEHGPRNCGDDILGSWNAVIEDLHPVYSTIESLTLDVVGNRHWYFDLSRLSQFDCIESIRHFSRLRKLVLPQSALFSDDNSTQSGINPSAFLPASLQDITIKWPTGKVIGWLKNVALAKASGTLGINKILLVCDKDFDQPASWFCDMIPAATWDDIRNAGIEVETADVQTRRRTPNLDQTMWRD